MSDQAKIEIEGLEELRKRLTKLDKGLATRIKETNFDAAMLIARAANVHVPVKSGRLAKSIRAGATRNTAYVKAGSGAVPYAGPIHFGWPAHNIHPQPFIYEALDQRTVEVLALYDVRVAEIAHEAFPEEFR